jgi:DNA-binding beta-propeller fold protein YncE
MFFKFIISLALIATTVVANNHLALTENANFQLFAGQLGESGPDGDEGLASSAKLRSPWSIWGDKKGRVFLSDPKSHTIRVVSTSDGVIHLFAGTVDTLGAAADVSDALSAKFNRPHGLYGDADGQKLWICDTQNHVVREINIGESPYSISTIGKCILSFLFSSSHYLLSFVLAGQNGVHGYSGDGDQASLAVLHAPIAIHWDKVTGNKFIAEVHRCTIRMIDASGIITTIAGVVGSCGKDEVDGLAAVSSQLWKPFALAMDSAGHLLIADFGSNRVLQVTIGGEMVTIAGKGSADLGPTEGDEGLAVNAHVTTPSGLWVDRDDNIFISESFGHRVRQIKASDGKIYNMIGKVDEKGTETSLWHPRGIWGDDSSQLKLYVPDSLNRRIVTIELPSASPSNEPSSAPSYISEDLIITTVAGNGWNADVESHGENWIATTNSIGDSRGKLLIHFSFIFLLPIYFCVLFRYMG